MEDSLLEGLNMRAFRLLNCSDDEFSKWLDDLNFWKAWLEAEEESENRMNHEGVASRWVHDEYWAVAHVHTCPSVGRLGSIGTP